MSLELKFNPKTIEHLGVRMYSTLPPALAEIVSNSYDADAGEVLIEFIEQNGSPIAITITDNGTGMSLDDIQRKFLVIGRNRRSDEGDKPSPKFGRLATGKKGLGKLALFGLAKKITVDTIRNQKRNRFHLNWDQLLASDEVYNPIVELQDKVETRSSRTIIQLSDLKRKSSFDLEAIADSLSKIFVVDSHFKIRLKGSNGKEIAISNERRYSGIDKQFEWTENDLIGNDSPFYKKLEISLFTIITTIPPSSGLRGVALFSRGKLVNAPEYFSDSTSSHFYQYLTGSIKADFIDLLDEDVISTNRQSLNWDHPETAKLRDYLSKIIAQVGQDWRKKRAARKEKEIEQATGVNRERWFKTLPNEVRTSVEVIVKSMGENEDVAESYAPIVKALYSIVPEYPLLHWRHLHESIRDGVSDYYRNQQYGLAADQGAKIYAQRIRKISNRDADGATLADEFSFKYESSAGLSTPPRIQINDLSTESLRNIQQGQGHLTRGLMVGFRNPINHAPVSAVVPEIISELDCLNILSLVSYLSAKLDYEQENKSSPES